MATKTKSATTKAAVLDETLDDTEVTATVEPTTKQIISDGIARVIDATGIDVQKNRYKAMRAIAFEAFAQAIDAGTFDDLVEAAITNVDSLPSGWEIERTATDAPVKPAAKAKAAPAKATAKTSTAKATPAAKTSARKRPTR